MDPSVLEQVDTEEIAASSLYKSINGYNLYKSVNFGISKTFGRPILCDFSLARDGQVKHRQDIQPDPYRAPEVILEIPWSYAADVWNVGVMVRVLLRVTGVKSVVAKLTRASILGLGHVREQTLVRRP